MAFGMRAGIRGQSALSNTNSRGRGSLFSAMGQTVKDKMAEAKAKPKPTTYTEWLKGLNAGSGNAGDARFWIGSKNPWSYDPDTKRTLVRKRLGTRTDHSTGKEIERWRKAGFKLNKKQRKAYDKKARRFEETRQKRFNKIDAKYQAGIDSIRANDMTMKGLPVDIDSNGIASYNIDVLAKPLGISAQEVEWIKKWDKGWDKTGGQSYNDWKYLSKKVQGAGKRTKAKYAVLHNLMNTDPVWGKIDMKDKDTQYHISKLNFAKKNGGRFDLNIKKDYRNDTSPGWGEKYGAPVMTALASAVNPWMGALMAVMQSQFKNLQEGDFSWSNLAQESAVAAATAYAGGQSPIKGALIRTGTGAAEDILEGDFQIGDTLKSAAINVGGAVAMDLAKTGLQGGLEGMKTDQGFLEGAGEAIKYESEIGQIAQGLGLVNPMASAMDNDMFLGVEDADFIDPNEMTQQETEKFMHTGEMYSPGGSLYVPGIEFVGIEPGQTIPGNITQAPLDDELMGMGGEMTRVYGDNPLWGGGLGVGASQDAIDRWNAEHGAKGETMGGGGGDFDYSKFGMNLLSGLSPLVMSMLMDTSSKQKQTTTTSGEIEDGGGMEIDPYSSAGASDPYSTQQMFSTGIG